MLHRLFKRSFFSKVVVPLVFTYLFYIFVREKIITMETKLTLRLSKRVIDQAKKYALVHNISVSKMVESYLEVITESKNYSIEISPFVESLSGIIQLPGNYDLRKDYSSYLTKKYK